MDEWRSVLDTLASLVEVLEEGALVLVLLFIVIGEAFVAGVGSGAHRADLIQKDASPDVAILHVVKALVPLGNEAVDGP